MADKNWTTGDSFCPYGECPECEDGIILERNEGPDKDVVWCPECGAEWPTPGPNAPRGKE